MKVGKCTKKCTVLKSRVVVVFMSVGFDSFPFLLTKRETGEARARKKIEASTDFLARLRESLALLPFCINEAEATDTQAITVFNFVLCFFSMFFVCLFMFTFFCRSHYQCRHRCQRFLRGCLPLGQNNRKC